MSQVGSTQPVAELLQALEDMRNYQAALEKQAVAKGLTLPPKPCAILPDLVDSVAKPKDAKVTGAPSVDPAVEGSCEPDDIERELEEMLNSFDDHEQDAEIKEREDGADEEVEEGQELNHEGEEDEQELEEDAAEEEEDGKELEEDEAGEDGKELEEDEAGEDGKEEEENLHDGQELEEDAAKDGEEEDPKGKGAKGSSKPVATPARANEMSAPPLLRLKASDSLDVPPSSSAGSGVPKVHVFAEPPREEVVINSTTHKREYMRLEPRLRPCGCLCVLHIYPIKQA